MSGSGRYSSSAFAPRGPSPPFDPFRHAARNSTRAGRRRGRIVKVALPSYASQHHSCSAHKEPRSKRSMANPPEIDQRHETAARIALEIARPAAARCLDQFRLEPPDDPAGLALAQRQQALAGGDHAGPRLLQVGQHRRLFVQPKRATGQTKAWTVLQLNSGLQRSLQRPPEQWPILDAEHQPEKAASQHGAGHPALPRRFERAETHIQLEPAGFKAPRIERGAQAMSNADEESFQRTHFADIVTQKVLEL